MDSTPHTSTFRSLVPAWARGPYGLLLARSNDFTPFSIIIKGRYQTVFSQSFLILFMDQLWDRYG